MVKRIRSFKNRDCFTHEWVLCTDMTYFDILNYFVKNFCVAISTNIDEVKQGDRIAICDLNYNPRVLGEIKKEIKFGSKLMSDKCIDCVLRRCGQVRLYDFIPYCKCDGEQFSSQSTKTAFSLDLNTECVSKLFEKYAANDVLCRKSSRWHKPGNKKDIVAIFQCPGFVEFLDDRPLAAATGRNARNLFAQLSWDYNDITIVNTTPIPHRSGVSVSKKEWSRYLVDLKNIVDNHTNVLCCGEVAFVAYSELDLDKSYITICHLGPVGIRKLSKGEKCEDLERINHLANYIKSRIKDGTWLSNSWSDFTNYNHNPFHWKTGLAAT